MHNITLICTMHKGNGKCNSKELYDIIEKANPEVIFEEIDFSRTNEYYRNQYLHTVETPSLVRYLQTHQVVHIPVETYDIPDFYPTIWNYLGNRISNSNKEYKCILDEQFNQASKQGFLYLNSIECNDLFNKLHAIEDGVVRSLDDKVLFYTYKLWQLITDERENEMINNIYSYSKQHSFGNAVFITGAEHKNALISKTQAREKESPLKLNWIFNAV